MDLRVTQKALEDLELSDDLLNRDVEEIVDKHPVLKAFQERRSQSPLGQEAIQLPTSRQVVYSLHSGRYRGLTWFDEDDNVCWLLGVGFHESGSHADAYLVLKSRDEGGDLLPAEADYLALYRWRRTSGVSDLDDLVSIVARIGPEVLSAARSAPNTRVNRVIEGEIEIEMIVEELSDVAAILRQIHSHIRDAPTSTGSSSVW